MEGNETAPGTFDAKSGSEKTCCLFYRLPDGHDVHGNQ
ncbi:(2Fe-2S)-binding protein [Heyndrickxia coagulans]